MDFRDMTINDFAQGIAGEHTIAGGGSVSALAGAYGAALVSMVSRKTLQNKKYVDVYDQFEALLADTQPKLETFLDGIQDDITAFEVFERALAMPKDTEEEKTARKAAMQEGLKAAAMAPMKMARLSAEMMSACYDIVAKGNKNAASDALAGALMMRTSGSFAPPMSSPSTMKPIAKRCWKKLRLWKRSLLKRKKRSWLRRRN